MMRLRCPRRCAGTLVLMLALANGARAQTAPGGTTVSDTAALAAAGARVEAKLVAARGEGVRARLHRGIGQVARLWRSEDGDTAAFATFVRDNFIADSVALDAAFNRLGYLFEQLDGHLHEISRAWAEQTDLDRGEILPIDEVLAGYDPGAHLSDDLFENKLAFIVLLNFPLTTLQERLTEGPEWSRRRWAEARLAQRFASRIPAAVTARLARAFTDAGNYIDSYNIWMYHLLDERGDRLFPPGMRLISHWNLRDELKADYAAPAGLAKQRVIQQVMERIVTQTIPAAVIDNRGVDWNPMTNEVHRATASDSGPPPAAGADPSSEREHDCRYDFLLKVFRASRLADPYSATGRTVIERRFDDDRELSETRVRAMLEQILGSPLVKDVAALIGSRLGRPLEPFDIWYNGFRFRPRYTAAELDRLVARRYPSPAAFKADIPNILLKLGFPAERARYVASRIVVDPSRGAGHAMGAARRGDEAHLRTRFEKGGMNYKGYNIAIHELGHSVEQTFSLYQVDYPSLAGVPNNAFTEALAFVFQAHDLDLLGLAAPIDDSTRALVTLDQFWDIYQLSGVGLVDMTVWHWMYDHPDATPAELREATLGISRDTWNRYFAPVLGSRDVVLLGVYSHMISYQLYLPDYSIGRMIASQIEAMMTKEGRIGPAFERVATIGRVTPDLWMLKATGAPVGPQALLEQTRQALVHWNRARR